MLSNNPGPSSLCTSIADPIIDRVRLFIVIVNHFIDIKLLKKFNSKRIFIEKYWRKQSKKQVFFKHLTTLCLIYSVVDALLVILYS